MDSLMTMDQYKTNLQALKQYYVDLNYMDITPDAVNVRTCQILQNYSKVTEYMIGAAINLNLAKKTVKGTEFTKDNEYNTSMFNPAVAELKSKELREAKAESLTSASAKLLLDCNLAQLDAQAYYDSVKFVYENLQTALGAMKEQVKLFQNMLYMDPSKR